MWLGVIKFKITMKFFKFSLALVLALFVSCKQSGSYENVEISTKSVVEKQLDSLNESLEKLSLSKDRVVAKKNFISCRITYKKVEPFVEYYFQGFSRRINGPALPDVKIDDNIVNEATGFQVIEELIFSEQPIDTAALKVQVAILKTDLLFVRKNLRDLPIQNHHLYELLQHQIIRNATMGITGFDSPVAFASILETKYSLAGIQENIMHFCKVNKIKDIAKISKVFDDSQEYLNKNRDFDTFNRLVFIKKYLMPLSEEVAAIFENFLKNSPKIIKPFNGTLADLMQGKGLNLDAFTPYADSHSNPAKIDLGEKLFSDVNLSKSKTISCATCHNADKAFTDGLQFSNSNVHNVSVDRNAPTLYYAGFQEAFFYDLRSQDLENQIEEVMNNKKEFNLSSIEITSQIKNNQEYRSLLEKAFPHKKEITPFEIRNAIATYVRSLMPFNSKIDRYFKGQESLTVDQENGFNLFTGKAKCATCHFIPLYNGTIPPWYSISESEVIGVPQSVNWNTAVVDEDLGRYNTNQIEQFRFAFKTPTIRNIEKTAPYMHNGIYRTLDEVVKFYELGGGNGIGMTLEHQTLPFDNLKISEKEKNDLVLFMKTLTDR